MSDVLKPNRIRYAEIEGDLHDHLAEQYAQRRSNFTVASPFGQILRALKEFAQLIFFYIEDSLVELNMLTATKQRAIYGLARLAGHNPTRALSAHGTIKVRMKATAQAEVNASYILLPDRLKMRCSNNGLAYFVQMGESLDSIRIDTTDRAFHSLRIVQGELESQTSLGTGLPLQSFTFQAKRPIENEMVFVKVNGEPYEVVDSLYDMRKGEKLCMVKTGLSAGIDVFFGNEDYGTMPALGAAITVEYVLTDGFAGNIFSRSNQVKFEWVDKGWTNNGDEVDLNQLLDVQLEKAAVLGSDTESSDLTKLIAPKTSRSYVLAGPDNYVHLLSRFNYAHVDAYTTFDDEYLDDDNVVYLFLVPDLSRRLETNTDYYTVAPEAFYLDPDEKQSLLAYIHQSGRMVASTELEIVDPVLTKYVLNVVLRVFDWADVKSVRGNVLSIVTDYMLKVKRRDKLPKSDLIALIEAVKGVDSVNLSFVSEANERAILDGYYTKRSYVVDRVRGIRSQVEQRVTVASGDDPSIGLDDFGDVAIGANELPVLRGGWYDRDGNYYEDGVSDLNLCSVNVAVREIIKETLSSKIASANRTSLRR